MIVQVATKNTVCQHKLKSNKQGFKKVKMLGGVFIKAQYYSNKRQRKIEQTLLIKKERKSNYSISNTVSAETLPSGFAVFLTV